MDLSGIPHPAINWDNSNLPEQWECFQTRIELIFSEPLNNKEEEQKVSCLLLWVGEEGHQYTNFGFESQKPLPES